MTDRERILNIFRRKPIDRIVWQPRIEHWYHVNKITHSLPERYHNMSLLDVYRDLPASVRYYYGEETNISNPRTYVRFEYEGGVEIREKQHGDRVRVDFITPVGSLSGIKGLAEHGLSWHYLDHPVKAVDDLTIIEYIYRHTHYSFDYNFFEEARKAMGESGEIQFYWERSPFQRLYLEFLGIEGTAMALFDHPGRIREYLAVTQEAEDELFEVLAGCPVKILNFGENIDGRFNSPRLFSDFMVPYYNNRINQLHKAGKFCHIHLDGMLKPLLPFLQDPGFDGIEAATPLPQGDVTLEELKEAMGDTVLLDGIPMFYFLPEYSLEELEKTTCRIIELFAPNLILGISDEISPPGDIERVRFVSNIVANCSV